MHIMFEPCEIICHLSITVSSFLLQLPSSGTFDGFHIYIDPSDGYSLPITVTMATTFYHFTGLENGVIYTVTIATYNQGGDGPSINTTVQTIGECELIVSLLYNISHFKITYHLL